MSLFDQIIKKSLIQLSEGTFGVDSSQSVLPTPEEAFNKLADDKQNDLVIAALSALKSKSTLTPEQTTALKNYTLSTPSHSDAKTGSTQNQSPSASPTINSQPVSTVINPTNG
jgi:hypothetical protein